MTKWQNSGKYKNVGKILDLISIVIILISVIMTIKYWMNAPDIIPTHYSLLGEANGYGSKNTLFLLLGIEVVIYIGMSILSKYPQIYNYVVVINDSNREKQYNMSTTFVRVMKLELLIIFSYIQLIGVIPKTSGKSMMSPYFLTLELIVVFGSIAFYIRKSIKNK